MASIPNAVKSSAIAALLFFVVANPAVYNVTQSLLGQFVTLQDELGAPTQAGVAIHAVVYGLLTLLIMKIGSGLKKKSTTSYDQL